MKKIFLLLAVILSCIACDPLQYGGGFYVRNDTDQTLRLLQRGPGGSISFSAGTVAPGDSIALGSVWNKSTSKLSFNRWIQEEVARQGEKISLKVLSEDQVILKEWTYLDRNQPSKQYFNESFWRHYEVFRELGSIETMTDIWVFQVLPEDIE